MSVLDVSKRYSDPSWVWTPPKSHYPGQRLTADELNVYLSDNMDVLFEPRSAVVEIDYDPATVNTGGSLDGSSILDSELSLTIDLDESSDVELFFHIAGNQGSDSGNFIIDVYNKTYDYYLSNYSNPGIGVLHALDAGTARRQLDMHFVDIGAAAGYNTYEIHAIATTASWSPNSGVNTLFALQVVGG